MAPAVRYCSTDERVTLAVQMTTVPAYPPARSAPRACSNRSSATSKPTPRWPRRASRARRRAALLFALHALEPVRAHFAKREPALVADLEARVLPATIPSFLNGMAQRPEGLVVMASTLTSMWREDMGNGQAVE